MAADLSALSDAHGILLAAELCTTGNVAGILELQRCFPTTLNFEKLLRLILTFLPESTPPQHYIPVLQTIAEGVAIPSEPPNIDVSAVKDLPVIVARKRVRKLPLLPLQYHSNWPWEDGTGSSDRLTQFLIHRAHRIDAETGLQTIILDLLVPFYHHSELLRTWLISRLLPLLRLNYEYYPDGEDMLSLTALESMQSRSVLDVLLPTSHTSKDKTDLARNLRGLVGPWMYGEKHSRMRHGIDTLNSIEFQVWQEVNERLLSESIADIDRVVAVFTNWDGPKDVDLGGYGEEDESENDVTIRLRQLYGQTGLAVVYANSNTSKHALECSFQIASRVATLLEYEGDSLLFRDPGLPSLQLDVDLISSASTASAFQNLLTASNVLTFPTIESLAFLNGLLLSLRALSELGYQTSCCAAAAICIQSGEEAQLLELRGVVETVIKQARPGQDWGRTRERLLWLRDWRTSQAGKNGKQRDFHGLFWRVSRDAIEIEIFKAMLAAEEHRLSASIFSSKTAPLHPDQVETAVTESIMILYDNASNGNKTRGKMKKALDILRTFQPYFPNSTSLKQVDALISATHALSFYSLTLLHGVPFQPVSIRVHPDPLSLIEKVLEQNPSSYTKLDDLLSIGQNLVSAGLPIPLPEEDLRLGDPLLSCEEAASVTAERRILLMAVSSALTSNDFGTAYSYVLTRLTPPSFFPGSPSFNKATLQDDISWRAAYTAGRHRPAASNSTNLDLQSQITHLSQRMELISLALMLASPDPLPEILGTWRRYDEELTVLRTQEGKEAEEWDQQGDKATTLPPLPSAIPGGFGLTSQELDAFETEKQRIQRSRVRKPRSRENYEEAPIGLFDVARNAARAISKNAFPLHSGNATLFTHGTAGSQQRQQGQDQQPSDGVQLSDESTGQSGGGSGATGRVRKRDMVSNMVTGSLASGIGWVLGTQPVNR